MNTVCLLIRGKNSGKISDTMCMKDTWMYSRIKFIVMQNIKDIQEITKRWEYSSVKVDENAAKTVNEMIRHGKEYANECMNYRLQIKDKNKYRCLGELSRWIRKAVELRESVSAILQKLKELGI